MSYLPGDTIYISFTTQSSTGAATDADSTPTVSLRRNGAADGAVTVSIAHNGAGDYTASATVPLTYAGGDEVELLVNATVGGVAAKSIVSLGKLDRTAAIVATEIGTTPAILASSQDFNNTGQATPLPATTAFSGPNAVTLVFHDAAGHAVGGVVFTVHGIGSAVADGSGSKTVSLPSGTYTLSALPTAGVFWNDTSITVTTAATFTLTGTAIAITAPTNPSQTTAFLTTRDAQGAALGSVTLTFQLVDPQAVTDSFNQNTFTATSDSSGLLQIALLKSTKYQARVGSGSWVAFTTGYDATFALPEILGAYN